MEECSVQCYLLSEEEQRKHAAAGGVHFRPVTEVQLLRPHLFIRDSEDGTVQVLYTTDAELHHPLSMGRPLLPCHSPSRRDTTRTDVGTFFTVGVLMWKPWKDG